MAGIFWGVLVGIAALASIAAFFAALYGEGEYDFKENKYRNYGRGLTAYWYDRGWDAAHRAKLRLAENEARKAREDGE